MLGGRVRFTREEGREPVYKLHRRRQLLRSWFPLVSVAVVAGVAAGVALVAPETVGIVTRDLTASVLRGTETTRDEARQTTACNIKGNISNRGERIFHVPGGKYYAITGIAGSRGERWFCNKAEARRAGWRQSRR